MLLNEVIKKAKEDRWTLEKVVMKKIRSRWNKSSKVWEFQDSTDTHYMVCEQPGEGYRINAKVYKELKQFGLEESIKDFT